MVTGAGSGVGRAIALALAARGWRVALVGRRPAALNETIAQSGRARSRLAAFPCDIGRPAAVARTGAAILRRFARVDVLVNAAGTNVPRRSLAALSRRDYSRVVAANLHGAYDCVQAFLPTMRAQGAGTIVNINSEAGRLASAKSGPAYVVAKFGLTGLTQSINAEERAGGIRACSIFPGDIDTALLDLRPEPPSAAARRHMLQPADVAACALLAIELPARAIVDEISVRPR